MFRLFQYEWGFEKLPTRLKVRECKRYEGDGDTETIREMDLETREGKNGSREDE